MKTKTIVITAQASVATSVNKIPGSCHETIAIFKATPKTKADLAKWYAESLNSPGDERFRITKLVDGVGKNKQTFVSQDVSEIRSFLYNERVDLIVITLES